MMDSLPLDLITLILSRTSPRDACAMALVSPTFKSAAQADELWEKFLPPEYASLVPRSLSSYSSKKEIYLSLADGSVLIDGGKKRFWLDKPSGNKCYILYARDLEIVVGDENSYWDLVEDIAKLTTVCWFEVRSKLSCGMLSKGTHYSVYVLFKRICEFIRPYGFNHLPMEARVGFVGKEATKRLVSLETPDHEGPESIIGTPSEEDVETEWPSNVEEPKLRRDKWYEVELGKFYIDDGGCEDDGSDEIEISIMETQMGHRKGGLQFQGFEIRPETRK